MVITELRQEFKLKLLLAIAKMSRSSYYYYLSRKDIPDKYAEIKKKMKSLHELHYESLGYRRMVVELRKKKIFLNHKTVWRLMQVLNIRGKVKKKRYNSYQGEFGKVAPNLIDRDFVAEAPFEKLTTDVTQFNVCGKKIYLSPVLDMCNNEILSYSISFSPDFAQIKEMMKGLLKKLPPKSNPILHSDQGWQYQIKHYQRKLRENNIRQSMSRKGNCLDNGIMESFFGRLKVEMFYGEHFSSASMFIRKLKKYINYYNTRRSLMKLGGLTPVEYRSQYLLKAS